MTTYTHDEAEAALCMWEWMLEHKDMATHPLLGWAFAVHGTCEMRHWCINNAPIIDEAYAIIEGEYDEPFDFEFVPYVMNNHVDWNTRKWRSTPEQIARATLTHVANLEAVERKSTPLYQYRGAI